MFCAAVAPKVFLHQACMSTSSSLRTLQHTRRQRTLYTARVVLTSIHVLL